MNMQEEGEGRRRECSPTQGSLKLTDGKTKFSS